MNKGYERKFKGRCPQQMLKETGRFEEQRVVTLLLFYQFGFKDITLHLFKLII